MADIMADELRVIGLDALELGSSSVEALPRGARIVVQDLVTGRALERHGHAVEYWDDLFPYDRLAELTETLADLRKGWYRRLEPARLTEVFRCEGIDFAELLEFGLTYVIVEVLRSVEIVRALLDGPAPSRVVATGLRTAARATLRAACEERGIPHEIQRPVGARLGSDATRNPLPALTRFLRLHRQLRKFRQKEASFRVLYRRNHYSQAVIDVGGAELAALEYRRAGKHLEGMLRVAALFSPALRARKRSFDAALGRIREAYRSSESARLVVGGVDLWPHLRTYLDAVILGAESRWSFETPFAAAKTRTLDDLASGVLYATFHLDATDPDLVLVSQDTWDLDKAMVAGARARGIPSAVLQHGIPAGYYPLYADRFLAWGESFTKLFSSRGEPDRRLVLTGRPRTDEREFDATESRAQVRESLGIPDDAQLLLYVGQPSTGLTIGDCPLNWQRQVETLLAGTVADESVWVVIRPHPTESEESYARILKQNPHPRCQVTKSHDLQSVIAAASVVVVRDSTVSLDALRQGKPIVVLDCYRYPLTVPFAEDGLPVVHDAGGFRTAIARSLVEDQSRARARFLDKQIEDEGVGACRTAYEALVELSRAEERNAAREADPA